MKGTFRNAKDGLWFNPLVYKGKSLKPLRFKGFPFGGEGGIRTLQEKRFQPFVSKGSDLVV